MNQYELSGKTAVVTGAAQGIGHAVAARLLQSGARVACWDLKPESGLTPPSADQTSVDIHCDVSDWDSVQQALAQTRESCGPVDILVNSAGIAGPNAPVKDYDNAAWTQIIDVNLSGTYYTNKAVIGEMIERNYGRIVNIASVAGKEGNPNASAYSASKAGVIGFTKSLGKEVAGHDIAVNCITPAAARTPIFDQMTEEHINYMLSKIPRNRFLEVEEVASMVGWLVSAENSFTTASVFDLSGGRATY